MNAAEKAQNEKRAQEHTTIMNSLYSTEINSSINRTIEYTGSGVYTLCNSEKRYYYTDIELQNVTTSQAIANNDLHGKVAVLNFASFKNPGGGFIHGMMAQEEAICHDSFLYNVLSQKTSYYGWNREHLNSGLYRDRALYSPDVIFSSGKMVDVLTCAAPNLGPIIKYNKPVIKDIVKTQIARVAFICSILEKQQVDTVILGAWGCGVFKNDPYTIAYLFDYFLSMLDGHFKRVIFAIPDAKYKPNYKAFDYMINKPHDLYEIIKPGKLLEELSNYEKYLN